MKRIFFICLMPVLSLAAKGQGIDSYKDRLMQPDGATGANVEVVERGDAMDIVKKFDPSEASAKVNGYRVRIFFDNSQNARSNATAALNRFREIFPDVDVYMNYENPYFKVSAGNCLTHEEAVILWGRIKRSFEMAFITREEIPISVLKNKKIE